MFKNKPLAALVALAFSPVIFAASPVVQGEAVVVTATRTAMPLSKALSDMTVLGREEIAQSGSLSLPELLSRQPGVEVYSNGGEGKASNLLLRGAKPDHVLVLVDGMRMVSATTGTTMLEHLPLASIERIEILRGPASSLYGADAIGGVVQVFTRRGEGAPVLSFHAGMGAEGKRTQGAAISGKVNKTAFNLALDHNQTDGISSRPRPYNPDRDAYENTTYQLSVQQELAAGHSIGINFFQSESQSDYDSSATLPNAAKRDELQARLKGQSIELKNRLRDHWQSTLRYSDTLDQQDNFTKDNFSSPASFVETRQNEWQWQHDVQLQGLGQVSLGLGQTGQQVATNTAAINGTRRTVESVFAAYQGSFGAHGIQGSLRHDDNSQFGDKATGQLAYGYAVSPGWLLSAAYGTAFKAPTFNQLYYPGSGANYHGNPALKPEEASNTELAVKWQQPGARASLTLFDNRIENLIATKSSSDGLQINIAQAHIIGQTLAAMKQWGDVSLEGSLTSQRATDTQTGKLLKRHAKRFAALTAAWQLDRTRLTAEWRGSSHRFDDDANATVLGGYGVVNLGADYQLDKNWQLNARVSNIADKEYQTVLNYNQYRRGWFVGVRYAR